MEGREKRGGIKEGRDYISELFPNSSPDILISVTIYTIAAKNVFRLIAHS